jgi:hypothetical protein
MSYKAERKTHWRTLIDKHTESGMSAAAFCKEGIDFHRLCFWRQRLLAEYGIGRIIQRLLNPPYLSPSSTDGS